MIFKRPLASAILLTLLLMASAAHAATVPDTLSYEGRLLHSAGDPVTTAIVLRFSFWKSADWTSGDASGGTLNTAATNYGGWYETQSLTPNANGNFQVQMGSSTALPTLDFTQHKYLQVEVKNAGDPDTPYVLLDPTGDDGADAVDRKTIAAVAYAKNAEIVGGRALGTASGNVLVIGSGGKISTAQMGNGTTAQTFTINADNASGDATLTFGNALLPATLKYSQQNSRFEFSDDVLVRGNLTVGSGGTITASGSIATEGGLTINKDNAATDATLTFGSSVGTKTLKYSASSQQFEFNNTVSVTGDLTVTGRINGVDITQEHDVLAVLTPEFDKAVYKGDGADNVGQLTTTQDNATLRNHYLWTSSRPTLQDYDVLVRFLLPQDFVRWNADGGNKPLEFTYRSTTASASDNALDVSVYDTNGAAVSLSGGATGLASASWATKQIDFTGAPAWTAGQEVLLKFHVSAKNANQMHLGSVELRYTALTGQ